MGSVTAPPMGTPCASNCTWQPQASTRKLGHTNTEPPTSDSSPRAMSAAMLAPISTLQAGRQVGGMRTQSVTTVAGWCLAHAVQGPTSATTSLMFNSQHTQHKHSIQDQLACSPAPALCRSPQALQTLIDAERLSAPVSAHLQSRPSSLRIISEISWGPSGRTRMPCTPAGAGRQHV